MGSFFIERHRNLIPAWRTYSLTCASNELTSLTSKEAEPKEQLLLGLRSYLGDWKLEKNIYTASDLICAAIISGLRDNSIVQEAVHFVLDRKSISSPTLLRIAKSFLTANDESTSLVIEPFDVKTFNDEETIHRAIHLLKARICKYPYNPILYVEQSRFYTILGQEAQAVSSMNVALSLAHNNRYILRSATRLFTHFDRGREILDRVRSMSVSLTDPWVISAEIALSTLMQIRTKNVRRGKAIIDSGAFDPYCVSELAGAIGMLELLRERKKKARKRLRQAVIRPNDNTLAQVIWINDNIRTIGDIPIEDSKYTDLMYEACTRRYYQDEEWLKAYSKSNEWLLDTPFSKRPILLASHIASTFLGKYPEAIKLLLAGLVSHPKDATILNNLAYSCALDGRIAEAEEYLALAGKFANTPELLVCIAATNGLIQFRQGHSIIGRKLYLEAIEETRKLDHAVYFNWIALLNYLREEILSGFSDTETVLNLLHRIPNDVPYHDVKFMREQLISKYLCQKQ